MNGDCVVDASVGIKLFLAEEFSDAADRLFQHLAASPPARFYVPDLFYVECANVLWKYVTRFGYPAEGARRDVTALRALALTPVSTGDLVEGALGLALQFDITAYDAVYAALAQLLDLPLFTADESLGRKLQGSAIRVQLLGTE